MVTINKMGQIVPSWARGVDPHKSYRESALSIDGPGLDVALTAHDFVMLMQASGAPAFKKLTRAGGVGIKDALAAFIADELAPGHTFDNTYIAGADAFFGEAFTWLRHRLYLIKEGDEWSEMPLVRELHEFDSNSARDAGVKCSDVYFSTTLLSDVDVANIGDIAKGGCMSIYVDTTDGATDGQVSVAPTGLGASQFSGFTEYPISGTVVMSANLIVDNGGVTKIYVSFSC